MSTTISTDDSHWPALMQCSTAVEYLDGKMATFLYLIESGMLQPFDARHRSTTFLRRDIDAALAAAKRIGNVPKPSADINTVGKAIAKAWPELATVTGHAAA